MSSESINESHGSFSCSASYARFSMYLCLNGLSVVISTASLNTLYPMHVLRRADRRARA